MLDWGEHADDELPVDVWVVLVSSDVCRNLWCLQAYSTYGHMVR
jgi:hypothetical protein